MPDFVPSIGTPVSPWGVNEFLRSTKEFGTESYMCAKGSVPLAIRDGNPYKELRAGTVMAKITSGADAGKVGPFCNTAGTAEVQTITPSGTWAGATGTYRVGVTGSVNPADHVDLAPATTAAQLQAAIRTFPAYAAYVPSVTGGPLTTGAFSVNFGGGAEDADVPALTFSNAGLSGGTTPNAAVATGTPGVPGVSDGRQTAANIVGLNLTSLPWQLLERDVEISAVYDCEAVQGWCLEMNSAGLFVPVSNTTAAAMQRGGAAGKMVDIGWH